MKEDKRQKPVYESPKVFKLDETESAYGSDCEPGSAPLDSCSTPGATATGCGNTGQSATTSCASLGQNADGNCSGEGLTAGNYPGQKS